MTVAKPKLFDLFCGAGGAGVGYARAGFEVVGCDNRSQPRYPYKHYLGDAFVALEKYGRDFDVIHASPPCQSYSTLAGRNGNAHEWPRLIEPIRDAINKLGKLYVIENVPGAPLYDPIVLCGTMFEGLRVLRHRLFESNVVLEAPFHPKHPLVFTHDKRQAHYGRLNQDTSFVQVTGGGNCTVKNKRNAMGVEWMTGHEANEAIPPAYTEFIGRQLMKYV